MPCRVGCSDPERATPQSLRVERAGSTAPSLRDAALADDLERTVDYRLAGDLIDAVQGREYLLIERVAETLAEVALRNPLVDHVTVSVKKRPPVQGLEWAGVQITRGRDAAADGVKVVSNTADLARRPDQHARTPLHLLRQRARPCAHEPAARRGRRGAGRRRDVPQLAASGAARRGRSRPLLRGAAVERRRQPLARRAAGRRLPRRAGDPAAASSPAPRRSPAGASRPRSRRWPGDGRPAGRAGSSSGSPRRGVERLLVEAGGDLLFQFLAADAIDEMHVTLCPLVVGGDAPTLADGAGFDRDRRARACLLAGEVEGDEVFLHYRSRPRSESDDDPIRRCTRRRRRCDRSPDERCRADESSARDAVRGEIDRCSSPSATATIVGRPAACHRLGAAPSTLAVLGRRSSRRARAGRRHGADAGALRLRRPLDRPAAHRARGHVDNAARSRSTAKIDASRYACATGYRASRWPLHRASAIAPHPASRVRRRAALTASAAPGSAARRPRSASRSRASTARQRAGRADRLLLRRARAPAPAIAMFHGCGGAYDRQRRARPADARVRRALQRPGPARAGRRLADAALREGALHPAHRPAPRHAGEPPPRRARRDRLPRRARRRRRASASA